MSKEPGDIDHPAPAPAVEPVDLEGIRFDAKCVLDWCNAYPDPGTNLAATLLICIRGHMPALLALVASQAAEIAGLRGEVALVPELVSACRRMLVAYGNAAWVNDWDNKAACKAARAAIAKAESASPNGIKPRPSPDPDNPAATEAGERKQYAEACRAGEIARAGEGEGT